MTARDLTLDISSIEPDDLVRRIFYKPPQNTMLTATIPNTLLIDGDLGFSQSFSSIAGLFRVPLRSYQSISGLEADRRFNYNLVLMDQNTIGKENILATALKIIHDRGFVAIVLIGVEEPTKEEKRSWSPLIQRFLHKSWGAEIVFNDSMQVYAMAKNRTHSRKMQDYMG